MKKPYVICHMTQSIDGKVTGSFLARPECTDAINIYYEINRAYQADAYACGRVTMEGSFTAGYTVDVSGYEAKPIGVDFIADSSHGFFAVAFDRHGRLGWKSSVITDEDPGYDNAHIIEVLTEKTDARYLGYLQSIGVSYIFAGKTDLNLAEALDKLNRYFSINRLLLEGGSIINSAFQKEKLIDEISIVIAPLIAGKDDKPLFFESSPESYSLTECKTYGNGVVRLIYRNQERKCK